MPDVVLVAPDTFKGSLSAREAAGAMARGWRSVRPQDEIHELPLSDGGEGVVETLVAATGGSVGWARVTDALGRPLRAPYARLADGKTVVVELSAAAGLVQVPVELRNPLLTTTRGVGKLIAAAWDEAPFARLILALGGSATVDAGVGLLQALGVRFLDAGGVELPPGGGALSRLAAIDASAAHPVLGAARIELAVDVSNPLLGPRGAAPVYAPQKGASVEQVRVLEAALARVAEVLERQFGVRVHERPGTGSAGGVPATLVAIARASVRPGFDLIAEAVGLDEALEGASLVITGEGSLDAQSFEGKVVGRLAERCRARGIPLFAIAGVLTPEGEALLAKAGGAALPLVAGPISLEAAMAKAEGLLEAAASRLARFTRGHPAPSR
ncbi:MAG TPA: glycerate kinase [Pantanalinema sp.]